MKLIKELKDLEVTGKDVPKSKVNYKIRIASRAIIFDSKNLIALISVPKFGYHKLPGGGLEEGEDIKYTLKREIREEVGSEINIIKEVGEIIEYKNEYNQKQTSYCYICEINGGKGETSFTIEEKEAGFKLIWLSIEDAITLMEKDAPQDYTAKFIRLRDYSFLLQAKKLLE